MPDLTGVFTHLFRYFPNFFSELEFLDGHYLALTQAEKDDIVVESLDRYTTWMFWKRPDLCDYVLKTDKLSELHEKAAINAKENLMILSFVVYASEQCIEQGELFK